MKDLVEIRWIGRGGQGAVTAAKIFAESAMAEGKFIQAFPEYGPERMGAPVKSFTRISSKPIYRHCQVVTPDVSVVLDPTLLGIVDVAEGLGKEGIIIINTKDNAGEFADKLSVKHVKVYTVDASGICLKTLGRNIPNMAMTATTAKASGLISLEALIRTVREEFGHKFKDEIIKANIDAMRMAYEETKSETAAVA